MQGRLLCKGGGGDTRARRLSLRCSWKSYAPATVWYHWSCKEHNLNVYCQRDITFRTIKDPVCITPVLQVEGLRQVNTQLQVDDWVSTI